MIVFFLGFVNAALPFAQTGNFGEGYEIKYPPFETYKQNTDITFNFHVFNISNGVPIDDSLTSCFIHIYISQGEQEYEFEVPHSITNVNNEWEINIDKGNFTSLGDYAYIIQCNSTTLGGFESVAFKITNSGLSPAGDNFQIFIYALFIFAVAFLLMRLILTLVNLATASETVYSLLLSWVSFIILLITNYLGNAYLLLPLVDDVTGKLLIAFAFTNVVLPFISLIITMIKKSFEKKAPLSPQEITGRLRYG